MRKHTPWGNCEAPNFTKSDTEAIVSAQDSLMDKYEELIAAKNSVWVSCIDFAAIS